MKVGMTANHSHSSSFSNTLEVASRLICMYVKLTVSAIITCQTFLTLHRYTAYDTTDRALQ
jgi:hypothetical protein